jgi:rhomboid protease GluP
MSFDWVLYWTAIIYCVTFLLGLAWGRFGRAWAWKCWLVLALAAVAYEQRSELLQAATGAVWVLLIAVPTLAARLAAHSAGQGRYARAQRYMQLASLLHPFDDWRVSARIAAALALARRGEIAAAEARLGALADDPRLGADARALARAHRLRLTEDWDALAALHFDERARDGLSLLAARVRALGETGRLGEMVALLDRYGGGGAQHLLLLSRLYGLAFCGRIAAVARLMPLLSLDAEIKEFWLATAELAGGAREAGLARLARLAKSDNALTARAVARRRAVAPAAPEERLTAAHERALAALEAGLARDAPYSGGIYAGMARSYVVLALVLVNVGFFIVELMRGASESEEGLIALGAVDAQHLFADGEWWRLVTMMFLHFGWLHLLLNMFALVVIGVSVEEMLGRWRTLVVYFAAGIGSAPLVAAAMPPDETLVGASGAIFGLVGAQMALLARGWRHRRSRQARQRLATLGVIVLLQALFDLATPEVSGAAHIAGLAIGAVAAALVSLGRRRAGAA